MLSRVAAPLRPSTGYPEDDMEVYIDAVFRLFRVIFLDLCHLKMTFPWFYGLFMYTCLGLCLHDVIFVSSSLVIFRRFERSHHKKSYEKVCRYYKKSYDFL